MRRLIARVAIATTAFAGTVGTADAAVKTQRCAWWNLDNGDALVIDAIGNSISCRRAKAVGDAYLAHPKWFPDHLRAAGRRWTRYRPSDPPIPRCA
jgi:hypothetical protein